MILKLINHKEEYAVREIAASFFPKTKFEFLEDIQGSDYIVSEYAFISGVHRYSAYASIGGKYAKASFDESYYNKTLIKKSVAHVLKEITGIHLPWGVLTGIRPSKIIRELKLSGKSGYEAKEYLKSFYEADEDKADLAYEVEKNEAPITHNMKKDGISL